MVWSAVFFVLGCNDDDGLCSVLGVGVLGSNVIFALGSSYTVAKAFQRTNGLGAKLNMLSSALSLRLCCHRGVEEKPTDAPPPTTMPGVELALTTFRMDEQRSEESVVVISDERLPSETTSETAADEDLPAGWDSAVDEDGDTYYFNEESGVTQWEIPQNTAGEEKKSARWSVNPMGKL